MQAVVHAIQRQAVDCRAFGFGLPAQAAQQRACR